jgi:glutamate/tyrosine decarboxylase-like PLP-dependent enzyme
MPTEARLAELRAPVGRPLPHPGEAELRAAARAIEDWAFRHHATLSDQPIGLCATPQELAAALDRPATDRPESFEAILKDFEQFVTPNAFRVYHPRFLAFVPGAPSLPSILGDWLASAANFFAGVWLEASGPAQVETTVLNWFRDWLGLPETTRGILTSGGSEANLTALVVARERVAFEHRGRMVLYVAEQRHSSIDRAAKVMGLHPRHMRPVPVDDNFRLRAETLAAAVRQDRVAGLLPWAVVANAGATNTGTVDALAEIAGVCRREQLWLHVDAAYGWAAALGRDAAELRGIELADSVTLDPHKWLAQTFDAGCLLMREGHRLEETFAVLPPYLQDAAAHEGEVNYADRGIALTRRFRALKIWFSVRLLGLDWFRQLADHCCDLAAYAQGRLESAGCFEILCPRRLSIVCFRYVSAGVHDLDELNARILDALRETGRAFLSSTRLRGQYAIRMCFVNWRTSAGDVDEIIDLLVDLGRKVTAGQIVPTFPPRPGRPDAGNAPPT